MSIDNFLAVIKIKNKYAGFDLPSDFNNFKKLSLKRAKFLAKTLSEAFEKAEEYCQKNLVEYGIRYIRNL